MNSKEKEGRVPIKSLRTYQGDIDELMSQDKHSATTILVAEQKRREERPEMAVQQALGQNEARNKTLFMVGGVLLLLGIITVGVSYYIRSMEQVEVVQKTKAIIAFTLEKNIPAVGVSREQFTNTVVSEKDSFNQPLNSVLFLNTTSVGENVLPTGELLELLAPSMPAPLSRSFASRYMLGVLSYNTNEVFLILKTEDFASSYSGMLRWEKDMASDLSKIFNINQSLEELGGTFTDEELRNKDLRILKNSEGKTTLVYSFIDKNTLVITKNEDIFNAILAKYLTNQNIR